MEEAGGSVRVWACGRVCVCQLCLALSSSRAALWPGPPVSKQTRRNMLRARPSPQGPPPRSKAAGHNASRWLSLPHSESMATPSGRQAAALKKKGKKTQKNPHWPPSSVELAKMKKKRKVLDWVWVFFFHLFFCAASVLYDTSTSCHLLSLLWESEGGGVCCFGCCEWQQSESCRLNQCLASEGNNVNERKQSANSKLTDFSSSMLLAGAVLRTPSGWFPLPDSTFTHAALLCSDRPSAALETVEVSFHCRGSYRCHGSSEVWSMNLYNGNKTRVSLDIKHIPRSSNI